MTNALLQHNATRGVVQSLLGIHRERKFPRFPKQNFDKRWRDHHHGFKKKSNAKLKVAYFSGYTARYLFPDVAEATVDVLRKSGVEVVVPRQQCCGMPAFLEGDRRLTTTLVRSNVERWVDIVDQGYDIICSCPTCGYMLKILFAAGAGERKLLQLLDESDGDYVDWLFSNRVLCTRLQPQRLKH